MCQLNHIRRSSGLAALLQPQAPTSTRRRYVTRAERVHVSMWTGTHSHVCARHTQMYMHGESQHRCPQAPAGPLLLPAIGQQSLPAQAAAGAMLLPQQPAGKLTPIIAKPLK